MAPAKFLRRFSKRIRSFFLSLTNNYNRDYPYGKFLTVSCFDNDVCFCLLKSCVVCNPSVVACNCCDHCGEWACQCNYCFAAPPNGSNFVDAAAFIRKNEQSMLNLVQNF